MQQTATSAGTSEATGVRGLPIVITATFTAEPIEMPLRFWLKELGFAGTLSFAPYNQVFQQLLDPSSATCQNAEGINLVLVRFEDWTRFRAEGHDEELLRQNVDELITALRAFGSRSTTPTLVWIGPPSPAVAKEARFMTLLGELEAKFRAAPHGLEMLHWLDATAVDPYPVERVYDPQRDRIGHIPFTTEYYMALATAVARRIHMIWTPPYKVLAMDCDNTIWQGIVGEDGPLGITFPPGKRAMQEFAVQQQSRGMMLCLVSKNTEADVVDVFEHRAEMPLKRDHFVAWRINWQPKAEGLVELAKELNLGLDSFIFVDDNPIECAEIRAALPQVLTLELPAEDAAIPEFFRHVWAFDRLNVTEEDRQRTQMYRQNAERDRFEQQASGIGDFLAGLQLNIDIAAPNEQEWPRIAQLTQRTNQFNFSTIRRTESEIRRLGQDGLECLRVKVTDRFGDYGLVGVVIFGPAKNTLQIDTMLLSCRVLGRGIEHAMLERVGQVAVERGLATVTARYAPTARNQPAANFLRSLEDAYRQESDHEIIYRIPAEKAAQLQYVPGSDVKAVLKVTHSDDAQNGAMKGAAGALRRDKSALYMRIATELRSIEAVQRAIESEALVVRPDVGPPLVEPKTPRQREMAELWARLLHVDRVGIRDDFAALGGTSLIAAQLFAEIETRFGTRLPMTTILEAPSVEQLAARLERGDRATIKLLKPGSESVPALFLVHDGDGETLLYANLAHSLPEEVAVYGIEPFGNDRCSILHTRLPEMAAYYIEQIQRVRPQGPYFLGGMCAGGVIVYEMAQQLRARGLPVGMVILFDSAYPHAQPKLGLIAQRRGARFLQALRGDDGQQSSRLRRLGRLIVTAATKARNLIVYEANNRLRRLSNKLRFRMFRSAIEKGRRVPWYLEGLTVRVVYELAEKDYQPSGKLDAPVVLARATQGEGADEPFINLYTDPLLGWGPHVARDLEVVEVPGGHSSMLQSPHVAILAEHITSYIERSQAASVVC
jgi:FkbH-like protein